LLTRKKLGYAPGTMDAVYLAQDIQALEAKFLSRQGQVDGLLLASAEFEAEARRLGAPEIIARVLLQRGNILNEYQRHREAIGVLLEASKTLGDLRRYDLKVSILSGLAQAYGNLQDWPAVLKTCEQGIDLVERHRYAVSGQYLQSAYLRSRIGLYAWGVRASYQRKNYPLMLKWAELSKCRSVLRHRERSAEPSAEERQVREDFRRASQQIEAARASGREEGLDTLLAKRRALWDLLLIARARAEKPPPEFDLAAVQAALEPDEAVLYYYWLDPGSLLVVALDREGCLPELVRIEPGERTTMEAYAQTVIGALSTEMPQHEDYPDRVREFAPILLPEVLAGLLQSRRRLLVSPHRLLHALPFHVLPWEGEARYLIQRFAITYIPNLSSLLLTYPAPAQTSLLAMGIFNYQVPGYQPEPLEEAIEEVSGLRDLYGRQGKRVTALCDAEVNEKRLRDLEETGELSRFSTLHLATHGLNVNSDTPMESFLFLQDSILDGLEIADWSLNAELVVLSACFSGQRSIGGRGLPELPGDDLFGLQAAFFAAGARQVLGALWPVESDVAYPLLTAFHHHSLAGMPPDLALQRATVDYLDRAGIRLRKTYFWAPYFLTATGRRSQNAGGT
jgi:CHAT domain-containing protein